MKHTTIIATIAAILFLFGSVSEAQHPDFTNGAISKGNGLLDICIQPKDDYFAQGLCNGFIAGVMYSDDHIANVPDVSNRQILDVVVKYLQDHPATRNLSSTVLIEAAFHEAWPETIPQPEKKKASK
jgi:hypothetical protein